MIALSIEDEHTVLGSASPGEPDIRLPVGWRAIARDCLKRDPPSALDLENAIAAVEDAIARAPALPPGGSRLRTKDARVRDIALAAGLPPGAESLLTLGAVEQAFQRLAAQASRGLRSADGLPEGNDAAAALVILRELMHHAGLPAIVVEPG